MTYGLQVPEPARVKKNPYVSVNLAQKIGVGLQQNII